jgi:hypothetical protein
MGQGAGVAADLINGQASLRPQREALVCHHIAVEEQGDVAPGCANCARPRYDHLALDTVLEDTNGVTKRTRTWQRPMFGVTFEAETLRLAVNAMIVKACAREKYVAPYLGSSKVAVLCLCRV